MTRSGKEHAMDSQIEGFLLHLKDEKHYSENTLSAYRNDLTQFMQLLQKQGTTSWRQLRQADIVAFGVDAKERGYAQSTLARKLASVRSFCHFLASHSVLAQDPATGLDSPQVARKLPRTLSDLEIGLLLELPSRTQSAKGLRDRSLLEMLYATGMRVSEVTALDLGDIDFATGTVACGGKGSSRRVVSLTPRCLSALRAYVDSGREALLSTIEETALFVNHRGERLSRQGLWLVIKGYVKELGLDGNVTPHTLRHSAATDKLSHGANVSEVQHLLGHANPSSTQVYVRLARSKAARGNAPHGGETRS
ncbi:MAG: tyrosine-type recombinase/integrase [Anaerolineae bacterium]